ncbi:hypothetical protein [Hymenobacter sp.]|uniref:hypothetical protein n=1 Tax=Hymenobacter sp. TaxID=1898978 RepID=UPI00286CAC71|nr:hypothetical protein [Hymenobacter sp.]
MTDRDPDPLYDALRNRLANHGQEPPAALWAGIRAQLPPPVAAPQLRRRSRRTVLLAGLLLLVLSAAGWQWWRTAGNGPAQPLLAGGAKRATNGIATAFPAGTGRATAPHQGKPAATAPAGGLEALQRPAPAHYSPNVGDLAEARRATGVSAGRLAPAVRGPRPVRLLASSAVAGNNGRFQPGAAPRPGTTPSRRGRPSVATESSAAAFPAPAPTLAPATPAALTGVAASFASDSVFKSAGVGRATLSAITQKSSRIPALAALRASNLAPESAGLLVPRIAALVPPASSQPLSRLLPDTSATPPSPVARRWAVQLLAGPALTYRKLGAGPKFTNVPTASPNNSAFDNSGASRAARSEQLAAGFGTQAQVRRALSGRWSLSAGMGYQEYAHRGNYPVPGANFSQGNVGSNPNIPLAEYTHRDTYRFVTVPVRLGYVLGRPVGRLSYGVVAGADADFYVGGKSPDASGTVKAWRMGSSPYRSLSLALSAGLDLRYRLGPHLELLAQPTATYFLTSLPQPISGLPQRHLLGGSALFGLSYGL